MVIHPSFFFTVAFTFLHSVAGMAQVTPLPAAKHKTIVIAHRGDHTKAPENTLAAYQNTIEDGADFVEIDLRTTKDSQLVIMHNATIDHMTARQGEIKNFTLDSLRKIKVREPLHPEWGVHTIPTFKEVLQLCKGKINIYLDFKEASVAQAYQEIIDAGMENHIVVYINEPHQFEEWGTIAPNMPLMISLPKAVKTTAEMNEVLHTFDVDILDGDYTEYNAETVAAATQKHIPIWADVQSKEEGPDQWNAALKLGLAGLQSDHPKELIQFLIKKGIR
ncbi:glycerophosphodiester phosphodiesterase family protein [Ferruginibacter paludis]|uniref:glycerophosphodiester phosphodiesterase n=1 Tax=Ferruginibacter paludis TaxID=1310417 RepID=UPI0025B4B99E|nr:glycerophosphodiester phosphodiesterase family protein [Ferruginibacter paludis]MDN3654534.1 glycerophosphodiester phosphodiesterase family protein [Ferruginibacter paludis]